MSLNQIQRQAIERIKALGHAMRDYGDPPNQVRGDGVVLENLCSALLDPKAKNWKGDSLLKVMAGTTWDLERYLER